MKFTDKKEKFDFLLQLIESERTGNPNELAQRICVSRRGLFRFLVEIKDLGFRISYCPNRQTYYLIHTEQHKEYCDVL